MEKLHRGSDQGLHPPVCIEGKPCVRDSERGYSVYFLGERADKRGRVRFVEVAYHDDREGKARWEILRFRFEVVRSWGGLFQAICRNVRTGTLHTLQDDTGEQCDCPGWIERQLDCYHFKASLALPAFAPHSAVIRRARGRYLLVR